LVGLTPKKYKEFSRERTHQDGFAGNGINNVDQINQNNIMGYKNGNNTRVNVVGSSGHDHLQNNYLDFDLDALENSVSYSDNDDASSIASFMDNMDLDNF
jgi:Cu2+-containing amine oxidase